MEIDFFLEKEIYRKVICLWSSEIRMQFIETSSGRHCCIFRVKPTLFALRGLEELCPWLLGMRTHTEPEMLLYLKPEQKAS